MARVGLGQSFKVRDKQTGKVFTVREKEPRVPEGVIKEAKPPTIKERLRKGLLTSDVAAPLRNIFFKKDIPGSSEVVRAAALGAGKTLGIPQAIRAATGLRPEAVAQTEAKGTELLGRIGGAFVPGAIGTRAARGLIGGTGLAAKTLRGATAGGITGGLISPEQSFLDIKQRGQQAGIGAAVGAGLAFSAGIFGNLRKALGGRAADVAENTRRQFFQVKSDAVKQFGDSLDELANLNPSKTVSLREAVDDIIENIDDISPQARAAFNRSPILKKLINNPNLADEVTLNDTQDIINIIQTKVPANIKASHLEILEALDDIRAAQLDAFPEMAGVRANYQRLIQPFKQVKNQFKFNRLIRAIENDFGGEEGARAVRKVLPPDVIKELGGFRAARQTIKSAKWVTRRILELGALGGAIGGTLNLLRGNE